MLGNDPEPARHGQPRQHEGHPRPPVRSPDANHEERFGNVRVLESTLNKECLRGPYEIHAAQNAAYKPGIRAGLLVPEMAWQPPAEWTGPWRFRRRSAARPQRRVNNRKKCQRNSHDQPKTPRREPVQFLIDSPVEFLPRQFHVPRIPGEEHVEKVTPRPRGNEPHHAGNGNGDPAEQVAKQVQPSGPPRLLVFAGQPSRSEEPDSESNQRDVWLHPHPRAPEQSFAEGSSEGVIRIWRSRRS